MIPSPPLGGEVDRKYCQSQLSPPAWVFGAVSEGEPVPVGEARKTPMMHRNGGSLLFLLLTSNILNIIPVRKKSPRLGLAR
jgi:hypothetical protein